MMKYTELLAENRRRLALLPERRPYDPRTGEGCCGERTEVTTPLPDLPRAFVPVAMTRDADYSPRLGATAWERLRIRHDFEYWAWRCVRIFYKTAGGEGPFRLNAGQRRVLEVMEDDRRAGRPVRVIVLKARQWGCSTLVAVYMAWYQLVLLRNCNSLICGHVKDAATNIRSMLEYLLSQYPEELWDADENGGVCHPQLKKHGRVAEHEGAGRARLPRDAGYSHRPRRGARRQPLAGPSKRGGILRRYDAAQLRDAAEEHHRLGDAAA